MDTYISVSPAWDREIWLSAQNNIQNSGIYKPVYVCI